jgi:hypothetical protein
MLKANGPSNAGPDISALDALLICRCGHGIGRHDSLGCKPCLFDTTIAQPCELNRGDIIEIEYKQNRARPLR